MKVPFSYKENMFGAILMTSGMLHTLLFVSLGGWFSSAPQYAVEHGPSSMEVVILNDSKKEPVRKTEDKIISVVQPAAETPKVLVTQENKEQFRPEKSIHIPEVKGSLNEAKPDYQKNPAPVYPELARSRGWEGTVVLKVKVDEKGRATELFIFQSSGYQILDESAMKTIRQWQFQPAQVGNISFSSWIQIPVKFLLEKE